MALTQFQHAVCRVIAANRGEGGESYVAGGVAINTLLGESRVSRDIDLFHDTAEALAAAWEADCRSLRSAGFRVEVTIERRAFVEAVVSLGEERVLMEWNCDSAFRFFPLMPHPDFGLVLHPLDLASNKVLALAGRMEPRDWVDMVACHRKVQPLGFLVWAACGKDPGYNPARLLANSGRATRYADAEIQVLAFGGPAPDTAAMMQDWREGLAGAGEIIESLPAGEIGRAVLDQEGQPFVETGNSLKAALAERRVQFHPGRIRGSFPTFRRVS